MQESPLKLNRILEPNIEPTSMRQQNIHSFAHASLYPSGATEDMQTLMTRTVQLSSLFLDDQLHFRKSTDIANMNAEAASLWLKSAEHLQALTALGMQGIYEGDIFATPSVVTDINTRAISFAIAHKYTPPEFVRDPNLRNTVPFRMRDLLHVPLFMAQALENNNPKTLINHTRTSQEYLGPGGSWEDFGFGKSDAVIVTGLDIALQILSLEDISLYPQHLQKPLQEVLADKKQFLLGLWKGNELTLPDLITLLTEKRNAEGKNLLEAREISNEKNKDTIMSLLASGGVISSEEIQATSVDTAASVYEYWFYFSSSTYIYSWQPTHEQAKIWHEKMKQYDQGTWGAAIVETIQANKPAYESSEANLLEIIPDATAMSDRGIAIRKLFSAMEIKNTGAEWTTLLLQIGWGEDFSDLVANSLAIKEFLPMRHLDPREAKENELADLLWSAFVQAYKHGIKVEKLSKAVLPAYPKKAMNESEVENLLMYYIGKAGKAVQALARVRPMDNPRENLTQMLAGAILITAEIARRDEINIQEAFYRKMDILEEKILKILAESNLP